ncbi:MAG: hypothetical protein J7J01_02635 [Methanophagales archaeon]|nr:hypothetical protein [Methanophagales archaeon]
MTSYFVVLKQGLEGEIEPAIDCVRAEDGVFQNVTTYGSDITLKEVTAGDALALKTITAYNKESSAVSLIIKDGDSQIYPTIPIGASESVYRALVGVKVKSSLVVRVEGTYANGCEVHIGFVHIAQTPKV